MPTPAIAVILPAYNAEKTIGTALASLEASSEPHDVIVVDDGSTVPLTTLIPPRPNLTILRLETNAGITAAINAGLTYALEKPYSFLARHDADDGVRPERLRRQKEFLLANPAIGVVGSGARFCDAAGRFLYFHNYPLEHNAILRALYYNNCFIHPSLMVRAELVRQVGLYSPAFPSSAEDYEWVRRASRHTHLANLPDYLVDYTISPGGISQSQRAGQLRTRLKVQWLYRNFASPHFYLGVLKTWALMLVPNRLILAFKAISGKKQVRSLWMAMLLLAALMPGFANAEPTFETAFSPHQGGLELVLKTIAAARQSVQVAAYAFTSRPIANALIAKQQQGVSVEVVLDQCQAYYSLAAFLTQHHVATRINNSYSLMHDKFMVVDGTVLQLGSFNYTYAAEAYNAENVLVLHNAPTVVAAYSQQWNRLWAEAHPATPEGAAEKCERQRF